MQVRGTFPALYTQDLPRSTTMTVVTKTNDKDTEKADEKAERESLAQLADRLGLRDATGALDLDAAKRVVEGEVRADAEKAKAEKKAEADAKAEAAADEKEAKEAEKAGRK